ncbi:TELO2-interacting protein 2 isoform X2 [Calypte anna]|uniref:TELO2-interacting protein 2 isoform X2 n=1 Tax=Calypte anna TaxID=9244 RepID=UPI0011C40354|nr:TELO2-interacting protein 2 isoform X2 [Calypte anna]
MELSGAARARSPEGSEPPSPSPPVLPGQEILLQLRKVLAQGAGGASEELRELSALVEAVEPRELLGGLSPAALGELAAELSGHAAPPRQEWGAGDPPGRDSAYTATAERAAEVGGVFLHLLGKLEAAKAEESLGPGVVGPVLSRVGGHVYIFAATHVVERPWTSRRSQSVAEEVLVLLVRAAGCGTVAEFLRGQKEGEEGGFGAVMRILKRELSKDTWKCNPASKFVFSWTLPQVTRPWLSSHLESVLPPSLLISDDYQEENKLLGVQCLHHIILNVPAAELCQFNRAQVVFHALYNHLYTREPPLIQAVLLCLLDLLPVLERAQRLQKQSSPSASCHEVLHLVLTHMEAEHLLALRRVYARTLPAFVQRLGIQVARHLKRMERVILGYLEVWDGPEEEARLGILQTLQSTIEHAWPRMPCRLPVLLKALLKLIWDVHTDQGPTPELVKTSLLQGATQCLILLDQCSGGQVKVLLEGVYSSCEEPRVQECLRKVQENT